jgi:hypothetical protein
VNVGAAWVFSTLPLDARLVYNLTLKNGSDVEGLEGTLQKNVEAILAEAAANATTSYQGIKEQISICMAPVTFSLVVFSPGLEEEEIKRVLESASRESLFGSYDPSVCI